MLSKPKTLILAVCVSLLPMANARAQTQDSRTAEMLRDATESLDTEIQLSTAGLSEASRIAVKYTQRGMIYLLQANQPLEAEKDLEHALQTWASVERPGDTEKRKGWLRGIAQARLFLSQARQRRGRLGEAVDDASQSIKYFEELAAEGEDTVEPLVAYAVTTKLEAVLTLTTLDDAQRDKMLKEIDRALVLLEKWSQKPDGEFFQKQFTELGQKKKELESRVAITSSHAAVATAESSKTDSAIVGFQSDSTTFRLTLLAGSSGADSTATEINNVGIVLGTSGNAETTRPGIWKKGVFSPLTRFDSFGSQAYAINQKGVIVGSRYEDTGTTLYRVEGDSTSALEMDLHQAFRIPYSINDAGMVVGSSLHPSSVASAWSWKDGKVTSLKYLGGWINEAMSVNQEGQIAGFSSLDEYEPLHACLWADNAIQDLGTLGGRNSKSLDLNDHTVIVGHSEDQHGQQQAFRWSDSKMEVLASLPGGNSGVAWSINNAGFAVGSCLSASGTQRALLWSDDSVYDLNDFVQDTNGWTLAIARSINDRGWIAGTALKNKQRRAFVLEPVQNANDTTVAGIHPSKMPESEAPSTELPGQEYRDRPLGVWVNDREYLNNYFLPITIKPMSRWQRAEPPAQLTGVKKTDGTEIPDGTGEVKRDEIDHVFAAYLKDFAGHSVSTLELRFQRAVAVPASENSLDAPVSAAMSVANRFVDELPLTAPVLGAHIVTRSKTVLHGMEFDVVDADGFHSEFSMHQRAYFVEADGFVAGFYWSVSDPDERNAVDSWMQEMVQVAPAGLTTRELQEAHTSFKTRIASRMSEPDFRKTQDEIHQLIRDRGIAVTRLQDVLTRPVGGGFFGGGANRLGKMVTAEEVRKIAVNRAERAAELSTDLYDTLIEE